jgi:acetyltransferase-like isoleucine patch superfamily enzyme
MRKINLAQAASFSAMLIVILLLGIGSSWFALGRAPLGDFKALAIAAFAVLAVFLYAFVIYRAFLAVLPLKLGVLPVGSRAEFAAQVNILFYLMLFNALVRTHFVPVPLMRWVYIALGAKLGRDTYSAGALLDPPLTIIGDNCIVGHDAVVFAHVIEGSRFELFQVKIGNDVTIGAHAVVMPDVSIDDGAIVSVGAVVTKGTRIPAGEIWGGVPARRIGFRPTPPVAPDAPVAPG